MHFSDNDSDTDDDYMQEEDAEDLSDNSDGGISEDEDEILYSVKRYYLLCIRRFVSDLVINYSSYHI